jgi:anti-sigma factor RsiW
VTQPPAHIDDNVLSAFVDQQLTPDESTNVIVHLQTCPACQAHLDGFRSVASLLRQLPELDPPRDFSVGPRLLVDPPNVLRLRRWYTATRVAAGALAAVFVFLLAGTLYVDSQPGPSASARPAALSAPARAAATIAPTLAARAAVAAQAPAAGAAAAPRQAPINPQADDQVAAATSVSPLPTPVPTPAPTAVLVPVTAPAIAEPPGSAAPFGLAALVVGILAVLALLTAVIVRRRLRRASQS